MRLVITFEHLTPLVDAVRKHSTHDNPLSMLMVHSYNSARYLPVLSVSQLKDFAVHGTLYRFATEIVSKCSKILRQQIVTLYKGDDYQLERQGSVGMRFKRQQSVKPAPYSPQSTRTETDSPEFTLSAVYAYVENHN